MPLVLWCMFLPLGIGIEMHQQLKDFVQCQKQEERIDIISGMYRKEFVKELIGEGYEH